MLPSRKKLAERLAGVEPTNYYLFAAAFAVFMGIAFGPFGSYLFEQVMIIPCVLFLRAVLTRDLSSDARKALTLSGVMFGWFLFLQIIRDLGFFEVYPFSTYFCSYFFAFPLAALLQDGDKKLALKLFAMAFIAASACHAFATLLLFLDLIPAYFNQYHVFWDGARLNSFWHPNMVACFLMFGIASCLAFLQESKKLWVKLALLTAILAFLVTMAFTNCRTVIILTGGILGGAAFYAIIRGRWKLLVPGVIVACAMVVAVYIGCNRLYEANTDALIVKQTAEYMQQAAVSSETAAETADDTAEPAVDAANVAEDAAKAAEDAVVSGGTSGQGTLLDDLSSLNSRTHLWQSALTALKANSLYPLIGVDNPGRHMSYFSRFAQTHTHNSWVETLLGLGIPGFAVAMVFTLLTLWNGIVILLKYPLDVWKRTIAMLTLCMLVASFMEPYLFLPPIDYYLYNFIFLLCAGYLLHWQEADNRKLVQSLRKFLHI